NTIKPSARVNHLAMVLCLKSRITTNRIKVKERAKKPFHITLNQTGTGESFGKNGYASMVNSKNKPDPKTDLSMRVLTLSSLRIRGNSVAISLQKNIKAPKMVKGFIMVFNS